MDGKAVIEQIRTGDFAFLLKAHFCPFLNIVYGLYRFGK
jgi:hypothetical protein